MKCVPVHHGIPAVLRRDEPWLHRHSENGALRSKHNSDFKHNPAGCLCVLHSSSTYFYSSDKEQHDSSYSVQVYLASALENPTLWQANNKGTDQHAHAHSLISAVVNRSP